MPICYRCHKNKPRYKGSTLCRVCYERASSKKRAKKTKYKVKK